MKRTEIWLNILTLFALTATFAMSTTADANPSRLRTTNTTESAPLNSVSRSFVRLASTLETSSEAERLTYKILDRAKNENAFGQELRDLLVNVAGGPSEAAVSNLQDVSPAMASTVLDYFLGNLSSTDASQSLSASVKAALNARADIKLYTADVHTVASDSRALLLRDEETNELLLIDLAVR